MDCANFSVFREGCGAWGACTSPAELPGASHGSRTLSCGAGQGALGLGFLFPPSWRPLVCVWKSVCSVPGTNPGAPAERLRATGHRVTARPREVPSCTSRGSQEVKPRLCGSAGPSAAARVATVRGREWTWAPGLCLGGGTSEFPRSALPGDTPWPWGQQPGTAAACGKGQSLGGGAGPQQ